VGRPRRLVIGIGNPSRGDDALGPLAIERLEALQLPDLELLTDFQLQVEYLLDLEGREWVVFIDADLAGPGPFSYAPATARDDPSYTSHALSPQAVLAAYQRHYGTAPPPAHVLAIRGYQFDLGADLSPEARGNLEEAMVFLVPQLTDEAV
jgi:hydrogenase maturation protease